MAHQLLFEDVTVFEVFYCREPKGGTGVVERESERVLIVLCWAQFIMSNLQIFFVSNSFFWVDKLD